MSMAKGDARSIGNVYIQFLHVTGPVPRISTWPTKTITRPFRSGNAVVFRFFRRAVAIGRWHSETDDEDGHLREALSAHDTDLKPADLRPEGEPSL